MKACVDRTDWAGQKKEYGFSVDQRASAIGKIMEIKACALAAAWRMVIKACVDRTDWVGEKKEYGFLLVRVRHPRKIMVIKAWSQRRGEGGR